MSSFLLSLLMLGNAGIAKATDIWLKLPLAFETKHPYVADDCKEKKYFPISFQGATSIRIQINKAQFTEEESYLKIYDGDGNVFQDVPYEDPTKVYLYTVPGSRAMITWECSQNAGKDYGYQIDQIFASIPQ